MLRKNKIIIGLSITFVIALILGLILGGLDRLDVENYGLNYNTITANFSNEVVYKGGLNLVGPANLLLEVPRTYRIITFNNIKTYTKDFFPVQINAEASYAPVTSGNDTLDFPILRDFYINFGQNPEQIFSPIIKNQIVKVASSYSSSDYQISNISSSLEAQIQSSVNQVLNKWSTIDAKILLSSIVCRGISFNLQALNRKIEGLGYQLQRVQARKVDMTNFMNSLIASTQLKMDIITNAIRERITVLGSVTDLGTTGPLKGKILQTVQATTQNLMYSSSQLRLRQQLYLINQTIPI